MAVNCLIKSVIQKRNWNSTAGTGLVIYMRISRASNLNSRMPIDFVSCRPVAGFHLNVGDRESFLKAMCLSRTQRSKHITRLR